MTVWYAQLGGRLRRGETIQVITDHIGAENIKHQLLVNYDTPVVYEPAYYTTKITHVVNQWGEFMGFEGGDRKQAGYVFKMHEKWRHDTVE